MNTEEDTAALDKYLRGVATVIDALNAKLKRNGDKLTLPRDTVENAAKMLDAHHSLVCRVNDSSDAEELFPSENSKEIITELNALLKPTINKTESK